MHNMFVVSMHARILTLFYLQQLHCELIATLNIYRDNYMVYFSMILYYTADWIIPFHWQLIQGSQREIIVS